MTGVVVRHAHVDPPTARPRLQVGQHFGDVAALRRKRARPFRVIFVVAQQMAVTLHCRSTSSRVHHNRVGRDALEHIDQPLGCRNGVGLLAGMFRKRAATALLLRNQHVAALGRQHTCGRFVHFAEEHALHAPEE